MNITGKYLAKLVEVLSIQTNSTNEKLMIVYLDKTLRSMDLQYSIDAAGNVLVIKGKAETYPCVVSHMDTVHNFVNNFEVVSDTIRYVFTKSKKFARNDIELSAKDGDKGNNTQVGVGGDDKCGVFACLYFLEVLPEVKVVFFSREEKGCLGSNDVNHSFFNDCRYIIQLDRRGKSDFISNYWGNKTISHELSSEIGTVKKDYGFKNATGTVTDSVKLWYNKIGISCMNISSGYYNPHSRTEFVSVTDLFNAIEFVHEMINILKPKRYKHLPPKPKKIDYKFTANTYDQCEGCLEWKLSSILYKRDKKLYCWSCLEELKNKTNTSTNLPVKTKRDDTYECYICKHKLGIGAGKKLNYRSGHFYCISCCPEPKETSPVVIEKPPLDLECNMCNQGITEDDDEQYISGERVCNYCWNANKDDVWLRLERK